MEEENGFLLLKLKGFVDANRISKAIAMCKSVREVFLTSGEYGFVATIGTDANRNIQRVSKIITKIDKNIEVSAVVKHIVYKKIGRKVHCNLIKSF